VTATDQRTRYDVGGVLYDRPFKVRRLGHFGLHLDNLKEGLHFYRDILGFRLSDTLDFRTVAKDPSIFDGIADPNAYFMRYGSDHHAFVLGSKQASSARRGHPTADSTGQMSWQVGSLQEVGNAITWVSEHGMKVRNVGRDMPGSNWHVYFVDPDNRTIELFYGMEQIGWEGLPKPAEMYDRGFHEPPPLPQISEFDEVETALQRGVDIESGHRHDEGEAKYDVEGVLLPRPFKIVNLAPLRLFVSDFAVAEDFYRNTMGFGLTEEVVYNGHRCIFLRVNTEHHSVALYPVALRSELGIKESTTCLAFGVQVSTYRQLVDAIEYVRAQGCTVRELPHELSPGIDYSAFVQDPEGHLVQLYFQMEQIGWDGAVRPASQRHPVALADWPPHLEPQADTYCGQVFLGPLG
jgi:catechol 2,3-dioxygenase-like lactoylglutathione lyase family enzyme